MLHIRKWKIITESELKFNEKYEVTFEKKGRFYRVWAIWYNGYFLTDEGTRIDNVTEIYDFGVE
jgi:hypothetical protein